jgi:hypothetical protein
VARGFRSRAAQLETQLGKLREINELSSAAALDMQRYAANDLEYMAAVAVSAADDTQPRSRAEKTALKAARHEVVQSSAKLVVLERYVVSPALKHSRSLANVFGPLQAILSRRLVNASKQAFSPPTESMVTQLKEEIQALRADIAAVDKLIAANDVALGNEETALKAQAEIVEGYVRIVERTDRVLAVVGRLVNITRPLAEQERLAAEEV